MRKNSSNSSMTKSGNTIQISPSKHWCFTLNSYSQTHIDYILNIDKEIVPKYVFQEECGESGTAHLQGYLCFGTKKRPHSVFKKEWGAHWEKCRNIKASIKYCQKEDTRKEGTKPYYRGIDPPYSINIEFYEWEKELHSILLNKPDDRTIHWIYEKKGCRGKTTFQKWCYLNLERCITLSGKPSDMKNGILQYYIKNNTFPLIVFMNISRDNHLNDFSGIEAIKDMFFYSPKYEGGMVCGPSPHVMIFANYKPETYHLSKDRWNIKKI